MRRKGQMFIIGAIIIITALILIKAMFVSYSQVSVSTEIGLYDGFLVENIENEYQRVAAMKYVHGINALDDFSGYLREKVDGFGLLYFYSERDGLGGYLITIGNYLGHNITVSIGAFSDNLDDETYTQTTSSISDITFSYGEDSVSLDLNSNFVIFYVINLENGRVVKEDVYEAM